MADTFLFTNNAKSILASGITNVATTLIVQAGDGALFPSPSAGQRFPVTLADAAGNKEVAYCSSRSSDTFTISRGEEGTTGLAFAADDAVELRWTKGLAEQTAQKDDNEQTGLHSENSTEWNGAVKTVGTGAPSGGADDDIHFQYE